MQAVSKAPVATQPSVVFDQSSERVIVSLRLHREGVYAVSLNYRDTLLNNGECTLLVLTGQW